MEFGLLSVLVLGFCSLHNVQGQIVGVGQCPDRPVVQNFDAGKYIGTWFEYLRVLNTFETGGKCNLAEYTENPNGTIGVKNSMIVELTGQTRIIEGWARSMVTDGSAKYGLNYPSRPPPGDKPYWVLYVDYDNFALVWSCTELLLLNMQYMWILTRQQVPSEATMEKIDDILEDLNLDRTLFFPTDHTNCD